MRRLAVIALLLGAPVGSACLKIGGPPIPGIPPCCTPACIETLLGCQIPPPGSPDYTCYVPGLSGDKDAGTATIQYGSQACTAGDEGAEVGCIAQKFSGNACAVIIADAGLTGLQAQIDLACPGGFSPGTCDATCLTCQEACEQTSVDCNSGCLDAGTFYGCLGCNAACNQVQLKCGLACLKE